MLQSDPKSIKELFDNADLLSKSLEDNMHEVFSSNLVINFGTQFEQGGMEATLLKLCALQLYFILQMPTAEYCNNCVFPFKQMGACPHPNQSIFWAYVSMIPYVTPILIFVLFLLSRKIIHLRWFLLMASAYIAGDKLVKNIVRSPRPLFSCKTSFGMPSSHMTVMVAICFVRLSSSSVHPTQKILWILLTFLEGYSRIILNYHTLAQVVAGSFFGLIYTIIFNKLWPIFVDPWLHKLSNWTEGRIQIPTHQLSSNQ